MIPLQFRISTVLSAVALLPFAAVELTDPLVSRSRLPSVAFAWAAERQLLPPPGDGDIRNIYWELRDESELWLTLEPSSGDRRHKRMLTITWRFAGRRPSALPKELDVTAYASPLSVAAWSSG